MSYLSDKEKRLLFSALSRERVICKKLDESSGEYKDRIQLEPIVEGLERKFYYDRFEKEIRDKAIEEFTKAVTDKIVAKYCRGDLTSQYIGMQTCDWIKEIAEQMKETNNNG